MLSQMPSPPTFYSHIQLTHGLLPWRYITSVLTCVHPLTLQTKQEMMLTLRNVKLQEPRTGAGSLHTKTRKATGSTAVLPSTEAIVCKCTEAMGRVTARPWKSGECRCQQRWVSPKKTLSRTLSKAECPKLT